MPLRTDETLTLLRRVEVTQNTAIPNQGGFYPEVIEAALDKLTILVQQLENDLRRDKFSITSREEVRTMSSETIILFCQLPTGVCTI